MERKILLISGRPPMHSAGFGKDIIIMLEQTGAKVDFLTLYEFEGQKDNQFNIFKKPFKLMITEMLSKHPWLRKFRCIYHWPYLLLAKMLNRGHNLQHGDYLLVFENEEKPPVNPNLIFDKIHCDYDYFVFMIGQDLYTSKTIQDLYDKYRKPIIIISPDMYHFTGNCFFPNDCENYVDECQNCPAYKELGIEDIAHKNYLYKKAVYENIRCAFPCNTHVANFIRRCKIISDRKLFIHSFNLDTNVFKPCDNEVSKLRFGISKNKKFIIMVRYIDPQNVDWKRKGGLYLIETLNKFHDKISESEKENCLMLFVGTEKVNPSLDIKFDCCCTGNLNRQELIYAYNASSVFLCPSINDSGPSMVNQAMACSTPVIAFNQGTAIDVVENGVSGFKIDLYDTEGLSDALVMLMHMTEEDYLILKESTRKKAIEHNSLEAVVKCYQRIMESFEKGDL